MNLPEICRICEDKVTEYIKEDKECFCTSCYNHYESIRDYFDKKSEYASSEESRYWG